MARKDKWAGTILGAVATIVDMVSELASELAFDTYPELRMEEALVLHATKL